MAGKQAAPLPGHAVTPSRSRWPTDHHYRTRANTRSVGHLEPKGATRATRTSADPPSWRLAGLPADDPVLGDRLGRGHRAAQPAAIPKATHHPVPLLATMEAGDGDGNQAASAPAGAGHGGGCARAPTGAAPWSRAAGRPAEAMVSRRPRPQRRARGFAAATPLGYTAAQSPRVRALGAPGAILGAEGWFTEWHEGQPASVGTRQPLRRPAAGQPHSARPHLL
jgi:hypothetical protein